MRWLVVVALVAVAGCSFEDVDLAGKMCPCAPGWECDPATLMCVPLVPSDAGLDAFIVDGGPPPRDGNVPIDAPGLDAPAIDAPGVDAPGVDAPGVDGGFDAGLDDTACDDVHASAIHCDGFEDGSGFTAWTMPRGATYATSPVYRGAYAMLARSVPASALSYLHENLGEVMSGELHTRAYIHVAGDQDPAHLVVLHLEEGGSPYDYAEIQLIDGNFRIGARNRSGFDYVDGPAIPRDRWVCLELGFAIGTTAIIELRVDGAIAASLPHDTTRTRPWRTFYAGITNRGSGQSGEVELYMDEVVVSRSRIGCD